MSIENLNQKLNGELPVTRKELIKLIKSWGEIEDSYDNRIIENNVINIKIRTTMQTIDISIQFWENISFNSAFPTSIISLPVLSIAFLLSEPSYL